MKTLNTSATGLQPIKIRQTPNARGEKQKFFKFVIFFSLLIKGKIFDEI